MNKLNSYNPATGESLGELPIANDVDVKMIVSGAQAAQKQWKKHSIMERVQQVCEAYQSLRDSEEALSVLLAKEMGKDIRRASSEVNGAILGGGYLAQEAGEALIPQQLHGGVQHYVPLGVVGVISPWNYPVMMANNLIVPALIAGNTVVLKPSEETPLIAEAFFGRLSEKLPDGVLSIVHGDGAVGRAVVNNEDIQMIAFTGSLAVGRYIMEHGAKNLKRLVMELGGNDAMIVLDDANLEQAARFAVAGGFENAGQMCTSVERVYVDEKIAEAFITRVVEIAKRYKVGAWNEPYVNIGPIINEKQHRQIISQIDDAISKGAEVKLGVEQSAPPYVMPTILTGMTPDMAIEQSETFGPVIGIATFKHVDEAIERANASELGLGAVVYGGKQAQEVAMQLEAGMVGINQGQGGAGGPWVGAKQSGFGFHGTADGHRQFAQVKVIGE